MFNGHRFRTSLALVPYKPAEDERRHYPCHQHNGEHAHDGYLGQRVESRMLSNYERANAYEHDKGRDDDAVLERRQEFLLVGILVEESVGDEYCIVIALTEDKGGKDDINDVELHAEEIHQSQYPQPAHGHWQERQKAKLQSAEGQPEEQEYYESAGETDVVEVVRKRLGYSAVHSHEVEGIDFLFSRAVKHSLEMLAVFVARVNDIDNRTSTRAIAERTGEKYRTHYIEMFKRLRTIIGRYYLGKARESIVAEAILRSAAAY